MTETELFVLAENDDIEIITTFIPKVDSMSLMAPTGNCYIGLDYSYLKQPQYIRKVKLAHELGHCMRGAFYNRYSKLSLVSKMEYQADKWAIKKLLPQDDVITAIKQGYTEVWQLAEYFDVTEELVKKAFWIYFDKQV